MGHDTELKTIRLLEMSGQGDVAATNLVVTRYLPILTRWASNRLPAHARSRVDTNDLVQVTLLKTLARIEKLEFTQEGSFLAYLRVVLLNEIRQEIRAVSRRPEHQELTMVIDPSPSPLDRTITNEQLELYEQGLDRLSQEYKEAFILRFEFGFTYDRVAEAMGKPTWNAARMTVKRAAKRLAEELRALRSE